MAYIPSCMYRPWTADDVRKATEGIPHLKVKAAAFAERVRGLYQSYKLNGREVERAVR